MLQNLFACILILLLELFSFEIHHTNFYQQSKNMTFHYKSIMRMFNESTLLS